MQRNWPQLLLLLLLLPQLLLTPLLPRLPLLVPGLFNGQFVSKNVKKQRNTTNVKNVNADELRPLEVEPLERRKLF